MSIATWEFESPPLHFHDGIRQMRKVLLVERNLAPRKKGGNLGKVLIAEIAQLVEHNLAKVGVAGPSPVFRSFL